MEILIEDKPFATHERNEDKQIIALGQQEEWQTFKKIVEEQIEQLRSIEIEGTETVEMFGFRMLAAKTTIGYLRGLIALPETLEQSLKDGSNEQ